MCSAARSPKQIAEGLRANASPRSNGTAWQALNRGAKRPEDRLSSDGCGSYRDGSHPTQLLESGSKKIVCLELALLRAVA